MRIRVGVRQDAVCAACSHAWYYEQEDERAKLGHAWYMRPAGGRGGCGVKPRVAQAPGKGAEACGAKPRVAHTPGRGPERAA